MVARARYVGVVVLDEDLADSGRGTVFDDAEVGAEDDHDVGHVRMVARSEGLGRRGDVPVRRTLGSFSASSSRRISDVRC